jgi:hypothetical protein
LPDKPRRARARRLGIFQRRFARHDLPGTRLHWTIVFDESFLIGSSLPPFAKPSTAEYSFPSIQTVSWLHEYMLWLLMITVQAPPYDRS